MQPIYITDPAWLTTFSHVVEPLPDEWFPGLLLRCDEVNHWDSGATFRLLLRTANHPNFGSKSSLVIVPQPILDHLAQFLTSSVQLLLATTYTTELTRLYPPDRFALQPEPSPGCLFGLPSLQQGKSRRQFGQEAIATNRRIHLCPACIAQTRIIRRTAALPYLQYCPVHHIAFQEHCLCGKLLCFFARGMIPFTCDTCGLDWAQWPQVEPPLDRIALEYDLVSFYEIFLQNGTRELRLFALRLAYYRLKGTEFLKLKLSGKTMKSTTTYRKWFSLGYLVDVLVSTGISPDEIAHHQDLLS